MQGGHLHVNELEAGAALFMSFTLQGRRLRFLAPEKCPGCCGRASVCPLKIILNTLCARNWKDQSRFDGVGLRSEL